MFTLDQNIADLKIRERNIVKAFFSMNIHQVATPEMMLEEARSYILFFREEGAKLSAYIALHLLSTDRKLYYPYSSNPFADEAMGVVEEEALGFAEGLGSILDEIDMSKLSLQEQTSWIDEQDIFTHKPVPEPQPPVQPVETAQPEAPQAPQPQQVPQSPVAQPIPEEQPAPLAQPPEIVVPPPAVVQAAVAAPEPQPAAEPQKPAEVSTSVPSSLPKSTPLVAAAKRRQEIMQKATRERIVKPQTDSVKKEPLSPRGVVSRDREALARLLTSF